MLGKFIAGALLAISCGHTALADDKVPLVGTWQIKAFSIQKLETNETTKPFGESPSGYIQYSPGCHFPARVGSGSTVIAVQ